MQDADVAWAQNVVNRWATKKAATALRMTTIMDSTVNTDEEMRELAREIIVPEFELWLDATGVRITKLMQIKTVSKLASLRQARLTTRH